ncbi:MAG TPA: alpha/beta hydrolase [Steroidobacteraceae bacterium]
MSRKVRVVGGPSRITVIKEMIARVRGPGELNLARDRARYDSAADAFKAYVQSAVATADLNGVPCEVHTPKASDVAGCIIYFHGGGYVLGSPRSHRHLAAEICRLTRCVVVVPDYALSPERPFPAALRDGVVVYKAAERRWSHLSMALGGDSAGGALAVSTALQVRTGDDERLRAIACLSPWMDLTCTADRYRADAAHDQSLDSRRLRTYAGQYLGATSADNPLASPLFAALGNLPPTLVQVGREELLYQDAVSFVEQVRRAGGDITLDVWDDVVHVWQWYWPMLESGGVALERLAEFLQGRLEQASA